MTLFGLPFWHFVFAALGATGVVWTVAELWEAVQAQRWPSVEGEVTSVRLLRRVDSDGEVKFDRSVRYHFEVGGRSYEHSRIRFGETVRRDGDGGFVAVTPEQVGVEGRSASALAERAEAPWLHCSDSRSRFDARCTALL